MLGLGEERNQYHSLTSPLRRDLLQRRSEFIRDFRRDKRLVNPRAFCQEPR